MTFVDFKVMIDVGGKYVLTATTIDETGRQGFWFSDYTCDTSADAECCPDRPSERT